MLNVKNLNKRLDDFVMTDVSFDVAEGDYFVLLGPTGSGKTVLLEAIAGLIEPDTGTISFAGEDITHTPIQKRPFGLVHQDRALFPHLRVGENIAYGLRCRGWSRRSARRRAQQIAEETGAEALLERFCQTLSGGEQQRTALARALAIEPKYLLLDEPLASLDVSARDELRQLLRRIHRRGRTILHVTHDYGETVSLASRIAVMESGTISQMGTPSEIFTQPQSEFIARFVAPRNIVPNH